MWEVRTACASAYAYARQGKARRDEMRDGRFGEMQGDKKSVWHNVRF